MNAGDGVHKWSLGQVTQSVILSHLPLEFKGCVSRERVLLASILPWEGRYLKSVWNNNDLDFLSLELDRVWTSGAVARVTQLCVSSLPLVSSVKLMVAGGPPQSWVYEGCCIIPLSGHIAFLS